MEEALRALLLSSADVQAAVSMRVSWVRRSRNSSELPAVVLTLISYEPDYVMTGPSGLIKSRVQADIYGQSAGEAKLTARALISVLNGYSGTKNNITFQRISIDSVRDFNEVESAADRYLFRTSIDLLIWHC